MAENAEEFIVSLIDKISGPASAAGSAIAQLEAKAKSASTALASLESISAKVGSSTRSATDGAGASMSKLGSATQTLGGQLVNMGGPLGQVQSALVKLGPYGMAAAAALAVLTVAITATVGALLAMSAAAIQVVQQRAALLATFSALGGGAAAGKATLEMVERLGEKLPFTTEQIGTWAKSLQSAGLQGAKLEHAIKAVAAAQALMGEAGGAAAQNLIQKLAEGGKGADMMLKQIQQGAGKSNKLLAEMGLTSVDVAKALGKTPEQLKKAKVSADDMRKAIETALRAKGSGALEQLGSTFPVILAKAKEGLLSLFDGLGPSVQPFMNAVKELFGEFSRGGNAIKIIKPIFQSVFSTLFDWGTRAVKAIHEGFQQVEIAGLKAYIALHPFIERIKQIAASESFIRGLKMAFVALGIAVALALLPFAVCVVVTLAVVAAITALVAGAIWLAGVIGGAVVGAFHRVSAAIKSFSLPNLAAAAKNMIASFISAITGGIGQVVGAMLNMGGAAKKALFSALGIASPSKVAVEAAANVTTSFADTVDDGKGRTQSAFAGMVKQTGAAGGAKGSGKPLVRIGTVNIGSREDFDEFVTKLRDAFEVEVGAGDEMEPNPT